MCGPHACVSLLPYAEDYDSLKYTQIKVIHITLNLLVNLLCNIYIQYMYLCCTSILMNILDNGITPTQFCQKWIFHWNDTYVEIERILQAIIIGL